MAFSLFGKRDKTPDEPQPVSEAEAEAGETTRRAGFFDRMRQAVTRTRESLSTQIASVVALTREVDEASLDDLEFALLGADIGASTTGRDHYPSAGACPAPRNRQRRRTQDRFEG